MDSPLQLLKIKNEREETKRDLKGYKKLIFTNSI